jgi:hypothetical protein
MTPTTTQDLPNFPTYTWKDLKAFKLDPKKHLAGNGFLKKGAATLLTGGTGIGKSVLAEQIAACVAAGSPILEKISVKKPSRVLYVQAENDDEVLSRDFKSIAKTLKLNQTLLGKHLRIIHAFGIGGSDFGLWLDEIIAGASKQPDLVVVDPYQSYVGSVNINDSTSFLSWREEVEKVMKRLDFALLLVAHTPKPKDTKKWTVLESVYLAAGTSALANWVRTSCELTLSDEQRFIFKLRFGKNVRSTGLMEGKKHLRDLFIEHSHDVDMPFWHLADQQIGIIKASTEEMIRDARRIHPDWSQRDVAKFVKRSRSTIAKYWSDTKPK